MIVLTNEERQAASSVLGVEESTIAEGETHAMSADMVRQFLQRIALLEGGQANHLQQVEDFKKKIDDCEDKIKELEEENADLVNQMQKKEIEFLTKQNQFLMNAVAQTSTTSTPATSRPFIQTKGMTIKKFSGKSDEDYDEWYDYMVAKMSLLGIIDPKEQSGFFLMYLEGQAMNIMTQGLQSRWPTVDWRQVDFQDLTEVAEELLGKRSGKLVELKAEAYNFRQGSMEIGEYYHKKQTLLMKATNKTMTMDDIEAHILAGANKDVQRKFRLVPPGLGNFLAQLREAYAQATGEREVKDKEKRRQGAQLIQGEESAPEAGVHPANNWFQSRNRGHFNNHNGNNRDNGHQQQEQLQMAVTPESGAVASNFSNRGINNPRSSDYQQNHGEENQTYYRGNYRGRRPIRGRGYWQERDGTEYNSSAGGQQHQPYNEGDIGRTRNESAFSGEQFSEASSVATSTVGSVSGRSTASTNMGEDFSSVWSGRGSQNHPNA